MNIDDEKISDLYHKADAPGPSESLDDTILSAARKAVEKPVRTGPFSGRWPAIASVAAVVVIAILLVPVLRQQQTLELAPIERNAATEMTDEETFNQDYAAEARKREMSAPSVTSKADRTRQQEMPAEEPAMPAAGMASPPAARSFGSSKLSIATDTELQPEVDLDHKTHSIMEAADSAPFAILTPEMWEVKITRLIDDGKIEQAKDELKRLEQHFPEHQINLTLLEKLRP